MPISFPDQVVAFLANPANQGPFPGTIGLAAFATASFTRRYGQGGFEVTGVTLGAPSDFHLQKLLLDQARISGFREKRSEQPQRFWYELRLGREDLGLDRRNFHHPRPARSPGVSGVDPTGPGGRSDLRGVL